MGRTEPLDGQIYVPENYHETMPVPEWGSFWSKVDASPNPVLVRDLDQVVLKELMAKNRGLTLMDLEKRSEYSPVTTTSAECSDEQKSPALPTL